MDLKLVFPFEINNEQCISTIKTKIKMTRNIISFSLPFNATLECMDAILSSIEKYENSYIYVLTFTGINQAKRFMENPMVSMVQELGYPDLSVVEREMERMMDDCKRKSKRKSKKKVVDEEGWITYK
ncbi:hypothetical protein TCON_0854 [Astathelohania contejeani]|uniref:Uncharacterized protein n=1 Tax=Astathelohania contejeani TaxID=164912 RepID=A0ABQ7I0K9_9MICR|nr:hypothetical protein TCON_0854 [Thelohania contejeani]